eukprot:Unigene3995_Nuclearia_a/m.12135 Unigene3995_Nuclearia_a/g.12135  ORF Unigene3995_Nuclearia_a/g.12135 Unigene3995_Nuclearia_a/m.12135 type:complete len:303 (-) Unigene3995_Nuclearia_a:18-926(-)
MAQRDKAAKEKEQKEQQGQQKHVSFNNTVAPSARSVKVREQLFSQNRFWADSIKKINPSYFELLSRQQSPKYLWVGCSDSRVPANVLMGLAPGEVFVHRNIANVVVHSDLNCLSVLQFAVEVLKVEHIIVCGHYGCGGVRAAFGHTKFGLIDNWLRHIKDAFTRYEHEFANINDEDACINRLCELNVMQSVQNVVSTTIVQGAWERGQPLSVHGWIYSISDGLLRELADAKDVSSAQQLHPIYRMGHFAPDASAQPGALPPAPTISSFPLPVTVSVTAPTVAAPRSAVEAPRPAVEAPRPKL